MVTLTITQTGKKDTKSVVFRLLRQLDWMLIVCMFVLITYGLFAIYSATSRFGNPEIFYFKQLTALGIGLVILLIMAGINYRLFRQYALFLYCFSVLILIAVLLVGIKSRGARSWFDLHFFAFQPAELTKIIFVLVLAAFIDKYWMQIKSFKTIVLGLLIMSGHIILILLQPDFSSCLVYFPIILGMLYAAGAAPSHLLGIMLYGGITVVVPLLSTFLKLQPELISKHPCISFLYESLHGVQWQLFALVMGLIILVFFIWWIMNKFMVFIPLYIPLIVSLIIVAGMASSKFFEVSIKEYQQKRLIVFLNPKIDPLGSGYNIEQSKIAIGSGKVLGKGYLSGTQARLGFIPEQHTDFIFSVISEEFGFFRAGLLLILYGVFIVRCMIIARDARDRFGSLVASGLACMFVFYAVINVGMVIGMMPVTGLPLPFVSYGGSSLVTSFIAVGILISIHLRRYTH
ncbi:MAG: rod shape-determining protein RodA [bacterium]